MGPPTSLSLNVTSDLCSLCHHKTILPIFPSPSNWEVLSHSGLVAAIFLLGGPLAGYFILIVQQHVLNTNTRRSRGTEDRRQ